MKHSSLQKMSLLSLVLLSMAFNIKARSIEAGGSVLSDTVKVDSVSLKRPGFFTRLIRYFDDTNKEHKDKAFDVSFIGGPHYSNEKKFGIGLLAAGVYSTDRTDVLTPLSNVSVYADVSTSGFYSVGIRGTSRFKRDKYRLNFKAYFQSMPDKFWGIGYENNQIEIKSIMELWNNRYHPSVMMKFLGRKISS